MIELQQVGDGDLKYAFAGDALNCAAAIASANPDATVHHLTGVGDDARATEFLDFCHSLGVDASTSPVVPGASFGLYWITTIDGDRRFQYWRSESAARQVLRAEAALVPTPAPDLVVISGITLAIAGPSANQLLDQVAAAKAQGATFAYDTNHRAALWSDAATAQSISELAVALADTVHASTDDLKAVWGEDDPAAFGSRLSQLGVRETIVTDGAGRVLAFVEDEQHWATPEAVDVVDTAGAGDAFFGTYLGRRLANDEIDDALSVALDVCTAVVMSPGAVSYLSDHR